MDNIVKYKDVMVSVIVPIYKVESFLPKCLQSVVNQTYKNLEIILVVDMKCTDDRSPGICAEYKKRDGRIQILDQKNRGLSGARNDALCIAKGRYIMFIDGDDFIDEHMIENLLAEAMEYSADLVIGGYYECQHDFTPVYDRKAASEISRHDVFELLIDKEKSALIRTAWGKLYKTSLISQFQYAEHSYNEDMLMINKILASASKIILDPTVYYYYVVNTNSLDRTRFNVLKTAYVDATRIWMNYIRKEFPDIGEKAVVFHVESLVYITMLLLTVRDAEITPYLNRFSDEIRNYKENWANSSLMSCSMKIKASIVMNKIWWICRFVNKIKGRI